MYFHLKHTFGTAWALYFTKTVLIDIKSNQIVRSRRPKPFERLWVAGQILKPLQPIGSTCCHQFGPVIGRMPSFEHALKHRVRITLAAGRSQGIFIIDPCKDEDPGLGVNPKK